MSQMPTATNSTTSGGRSSAIRFGVFEADLQTEELRKSGVRIKIQNQPFKVLTCMLERPGEIVSREEIQQRLWGSQTTVDFDHSLGTAINKLREALGDSADNPRFVETVARRGYRFIAPVHFAEAVETEPRAELPPALEFPADKTEIPVQNRRPAGNVLNRWVLPGLIVVLSALLIIAIWGFIQMSGESPQAPPRISQVTFSGRVSPGAPQLESLPATTIDGSRIYYLKIDNGRAVLSQASITNGQTSILPVPSEIVAPTLGDISPDGTELIVRNHLSAAVEQSLWIIPTLGGTARQLPKILAHDATWMPDGRHILFAAGDNLFIAGEDGTGTRQFAALPGRAFWMRWSPDGGTLRFTLLNSLTHTTSLWQISPDGKGLHPLLSRWSVPAAECCGSWTADGKYFVFQSAHGGSNNIWALREKTSLFRNTSSTPMEVTNGPLSYQAPIAAREGHRIFFIGSDVRFELLQYDAAANRLSPYRNDLSSVYRLEFSRDGKWIAWINSTDGSLWRSRIDGSERLQLTAAPMQIFMMRWSPDDRQLAIMAREPGNPWKIFLIPSTGGIAQPLLPEDRNEADPDWSPDGRSIVFGRLPNLMAEPATPKSVHVFDLRSHRVTDVPGSAGLFSPRWSPDGRYIAATKLDQHQLMLFDTATRTWKILALTSVADPAWSHDGRWIYFHAFMEDGQPIYRVSVPEGKLERVTGLGNLESADVVDYSFSGLTPNDTPLVRARMWTANIYSLDLDARFR